MAGNTKGHRKRMVQARQRAQAEVAANKAPAAIKSIENGALPPENMLHGLQQAAGALIRQAEEMAAFPLTETVADVDGNIVAVKPAKWTAADISKNYKAAAELYAKIGELAAQLPTDPYATGRWRQVGHVNGRDIKAKERPFAALQLRLMGWSFQEIADYLGYSNKSGAYHAINGMLMDTIMPPTDELRRMEVERLDMMLQQAYETAMGPNGKVSLQGLDRVLNIEKLRIRLLGLEAPRRVDVHAVIDRVAEQHGYDADEKQQATQFVEQYLRRKRAEASAL